MEGPLFRGEVQAHLVSDAVPGQQADLDRGRPDAEVRDSADEVASLGGRHQMG